MDKSKPKKGNKAKKPIEDLELRLQSKAELQDFMRESIRLQGSFGVQKTREWLAHYKRAARVTKQDSPTVHTSQKSLKFIKEICGKTF